MSEEIRVGDRFLLEVEVQDASSLHSGQFWCRAQPHDDPCALIPRATLLAGKRLPRPLKVGPAWWGGARVTIVALPEVPNDLGNKIALIRDASREYYIVPVSHLTLAEEVAS